MELGHLSDNSRKSLHITMLADLLGPLVVRHYNVILLLTWSDCTSPFYRKGKGQESSKGCSPPRRPQCAGRKHYLSWWRRPCRNMSVFLQRVSIACYAERCISHSKSVRPSVRLSVCPSHAGTESKRLKLWSWGFHWRIAPWL